VTGLFPDINRPHIIHSCSIDKTVFTFDLKTEKKVILHQANNGFILDMSQRKDREQELGNFVFFNGSYLWPECAYLILGL